MQLKHVFFTLLLLSTASLNAHNEGEPIARVNDCEADAPGNFRIVSIASDAVDLAWDYQDQAQGGYRIRTYRTSDNVLVSTLLLQQNELSATVNNLTPGVEYVSYINSRCFDSSNSNDQALVTYKALIVDLIVSGYTSPSNVVPGCTITNTTQKCSFSPLNDAAVPFKITNPSGVSRFFWAGANGWHPAIFLQKGNAESGSPLTFYCSSGFEAPCPGPGQPTSSYINIKDNGQLVARLNITTDGGTNLIYLLSCGFLSSNYLVERLDATSHPNETEREEVKFENQGGSGLASVNPQPFSDVLNIQLADANAQNVHIKLFNLSGQLALDCQMGGGQKQYSVPTSDLTPGFYLLRIEVDGTGQTLKVIKGE